ncbi:MAG: type IV pilus secretin PilQ [Gammaproteobacteria bacterium]|nr:type IV pilus secretin PilQ [Pseudomonadales bacterium]MCP5347280.1 type IV pilus secretin PilQ [Pseudomonadales bacterium]
MAGAQQNVRLESIGFASLAEDSVEIRLGFDGAPPQPDGFVLDNPARISIDLPGVASGLSQQRYDIESNNADSVIVLDDGTRTRLIVNLNRLVNYDSRRVGNNIVLTVGADSAAGVAAASTQRAAGAAASSAAQSITDVSFRRGEGNEGQVVVMLSSDRIVGSIEQIGARVFVEFSDTAVPERLNRRFDVTDFATPVSTVDVLGEDGDATVVVDVDGNYEYVAYQTGRQYTISVQPPPVTASDEDPTDAYNGEISSLSLQDVEIHAALQILADEYDFNLVAPAVEGTVTLQLNNVPWDQALDLVLRAGNLDKRLVGNVLYVAPAEDIAAQERAELEANLAAQALAPLYTEFVQINYANASDILSLLLGTGNAQGQGRAAPAPVNPGSEGAGPNTLEASGNGILSSRGTATVDSRTNIIIVRDVEEKLEEVRNLVTQLDVPVRQVLIEARIVNVSTDFGRDLGVRWGGAGQTGGHDNFRYGGSLNSTVEQNNNRVARELATQQAVLAGEQARLDALESGTDPSLIPALVQAAIAAVPIPVGGVTFPDALAIDLGSQEEEASSFSIGFTGNSGLIELELSALESSGNGEVIARPKVTTQDKVTALIRSGVLIPYQAQAGGTAGGSTVEFQEAVLSLEVTPQITPDGRIIMQLIINQDSVAPGSSVVPAINTNSVETSVLVDNGETIVLGGVFREETTTLETKTPVLGDVPYLGKLFKRTENESRRTELLIFITPKVISELNVL